MSSGVWVQVSTEEVERLAGGTDAALDHLRDVRRGLFQALAQVDASPSAAFATASALRADLETALMQCEVALDELRERSASLREVGDGYDGAEAGVLARFQSAFFQNATGLPGAGPLPGLLPGPGMVGAMVGNWASGQPVLPAGLAASFAGRLIAPLGSIASRFRLSRPDDPVGSALREITMLPSEASPEAPAAGGAADLAHRVGIAAAASGPDDSAIEVQRIAHEDGSISWAVAIPGTMGGLQVPTVSGVPMSWDSNVSDYLGMTSAADALVVAAMVRAGIKPGEPVVLAGHSLAGMVASNLARDPAVRERFNVAAVVTFGSPVAHLPAPSVPTLSFQHAEDGLPALSGQVGTRPGGPAPGEVVVVRELGPEAGGGFDAHGVELYGQTAEMASDHPGMVGWEESTAGLWAGENDTVTATIYRGSRAD